MQVDARSETVSIEWELIDGGTEEIACFLCIVNVFRESCELDVCGHQSQLIFECEPKFMSVWDPLSDILFLLERFIHDKVGSEKFRCCHRQSIIDLF